MSYLSKFRFQLTAPSLEHFFLHPSLNSHESWPGICLVILGTKGAVHSTVTTSERVEMDNPDSDGLTFLSVNGANICEISSAGLHVNGIATETSNARLKKT